THTSLDNKWQMQMAVIVAIHTSVAHMIRYKKNPRQTLKKIGLYAGITALVSIALFFAFDIRNWFFIGLLFAGTFTIVANFIILWPYLRGKIRLAAASVAH